MKYRTRPGERKPLPVAFKIDFEQRFKEVARGLFHRAICRAEFFAARAHDLKVAQVSGRLAIKVKVATYGLTAARDRRRRQFKQESLGDLFDLALIQPDQHRREREVDRIPRQRLAEIALQRRGVSHQMEHQDLCAFGRTRPRKTAWQPDAVAFYEIDRSDHSGRSINLAQVFDVQITHQVGVRHVLGKDVADRILALDGFGQRQAAAFGAVQHGRLAGDRLDNPVDIVNRNAQPRVQPVFVYQSVLEQLRVDQPADQRRGQGAYAGEPDLFFDLDRDLVGGFGSQVGFARQSVGYSLRVEKFYVFVRLPHEHFRFGQWNEYFFLFTAHKTDILRPWILRTWI